MTELLTQLLKFFAGLFEATDARQRSRIARLIRSRPAQLCAGGLLLAAEAYWASAQFPYQSSIFNHLIAIPLATILACICYPQWWRKITVAALLIQAAGAAAYLPLPPGAVAPLVEVIAGNIVVCAIVGFLRERKARSGPKKNAATAPHQTHKSAASAQAKKTLSRRAQKRNKKGKSKTKSAGA